jgi:hypothetical protein
VAKKNVASHREANENYYKQDHKMEQVEKDPTDCTSDESHSWLKIKPFEYPQNKHYHCVQHQRCTSVTSLQSQSSKKKDFEITAGPDDVCVKAHILLQICD